MLIIYNYLKIKVIGGDFSKLAWGTLLLIFILSVGSFSLSVNDLHSIDSSQSTKTIYLVSQGWHVGIVLKQSDIPEGLWIENQDFANVRYLEVGWGDKDYYQTPNPHLGIAIKAVLWPTLSVLHVAGFNRPVTTYFPLSEIVEIQIADAGFKRLISYIEKSYLKDLNNRSKPIARGLYGNSLFYLSNETYYLFKTCNAWVAEALHVAGFPISSVFILTVEQLMARGRRLGSVVQKSKLGYGCDKCKIRIFPG